MKDDIRGIRTGDREYKFQIKVIRILWVKRGSETA